MFGAVVMGFLTLFYVDNKEYLEKVEEQVNKGYTWEYVGYTEWDGKSPALLINEETNPHVYWKLRKPENDGNRLR